MRNVVKPVDSMIVGPLLHFSGCEVSILVRSNTVWNPMSVDQAFCKSRDGDFGRSIKCRKGKFITRVSIYSSKDKALSLVEEVVQVVKLPLG